MYVIAQSENIISECHKSKVGELNWLPLKFILTKALPLIAYKYFPFIFTSFFILVYRLSLSSDVTTTTEHKSSHNVQTKSFYPE